MGILELIIIAAIGGVLLLFIAAVVGWVIFRSTTPK